MRVQSIAVAFAFVFCAAASGVASMPGDAVAREPASGCEGKCERDYVEEAAKCGKMDDEGDRLRCQTSAHERYSTCRQGCPKADDLEACKRGCDRKAKAGHKKCDDLPEGSPERGKCRQVVEEQRGSCHRECDRKWK